VRLDPIQIVPYDPQWPSSFDEERIPLEAALASAKSASIEHIGSTAVPGCCAKPIIDMLAVVSDIELVEPEALTRAGWLLVPEPGDQEERRLSFCRPSEELRTHHLHVVEERSSSWRDWIAFRDCLRTHPEMASQYGKLKRRLASAHGSDPNDRSAYRAGKTVFVRTALRTSRRSELSGGT